MVAGLAGRRGCGSVIAAGCDQPGFPVAALQGFPGYPLASRGRMDKPAVAGIDADMGYPAGTLSKKQQVAGQDLRQGNRLCVAQLCTCSPGYANPCFPECVVDQPAAIKTTSRTGASVAIGYAEHGRCHPDTRMGRRGRHAGGRLYSRCYGGAGTAGRCQCHKDQQNPEENKFKTSACRHELIFCLTRCRYPAGGLQGSALAQCLRQRRAESLVLMRLQMPHVRVKLRTYPLYWR